MMQAIQRHDRGEANVVPVLLRPVVFTGAPFAKLQPLPTNGKPVVSWRSRDSAFVDIALGIERVVQKRRASLEALLEPPIPLKDPLHLKALPEPEATSYLRPHPVANLPTIGVRSTRQPSWRNRRGPILVALSLLGLVFAGLLLVQHPNLIPLVGGTVEGLILLTVIFLVIRALVRRVQYRNTQRREQEESRRRELEEVQRRGRERAYYEKALTAYEQALLQITLMQ